MVAESVELAEDGWYSVITVFPASLSTVAYRYESGGWFVPDPQFNDASLVGAKLERLIPESEVAELVARIQIPDRGELRGATELPPPNVVVETAGEFAAIWNSHPSERREQMWKQLLGNQEIAIKCTTDAHEYKITDLAEQLARLQRYSARFVAEMTAYAKAIADDHPEQFTNPLLAHMAEFERVVLYQNDQCDHDDGVAECWHFGDREGRDG